MDVAYTQLNAREFELTKQISLREWFPSALIELRKTGKSEKIDIHEALFDLDCPGHTFRRIKSMAVSIPCVAGPYASVNCSLTLLSNFVRVKGTQLSSKWYPADLANPDDRFVAYSAAKEGIITSGTQSDTGMFEGGLRDDRYLPFEGAGAISQWAVELLGNPRQFDYEPIADVVLTMRYTARPGLSADKVSPEAILWLTNNSATLFSMRHDFPSEWTRFKRVTPAAGQSASLSFALTAEHFPYRVEASLAKAKSVHVFGVTDESQMQGELLKGGKSIGTDTLVDGEGTFPSSANGEFDVRGDFELRLTSTALEDLWVVVDWSPPA